jgi:hypothetical protein
LKYAGSPVLRKAEADRGTGHGPADLVGHLYGDPLDGSRSRSIFEAVALDHLHL